MSFFPALSYLDVQKIEGGCHCKSLRFVYETPKPPSSWAVRACQCSFCRAHGARTTSDSAGAVTFYIPNEVDLVRYRFNLRSADYLLCRHCGVYIAAVIDTPKGMFATLNVNAMDVNEPFPEAEAVSYEHESLAKRVARREERWTPASKRRPDVSR